MSIKVNNGATWDQLTGGGATTSTVGFVAHGSTAGTARPATFPCVIWLGSVTPSNATDNDIWIDTT